jgi:hypothetical protein
MKKFVNKVLHHAGQLDRVVDGFVNDRLRGDRPLTPKELIEEIVAEVARAGTVGPDGPVFPWNQIVVSLPASTDAREAELRAVVTPDAVRAAVLAQLQGNATVSPDLEVEIDVATTSDSVPPCTVTFRTVVRAAAARVPTPHGARLTAADGSARFTLGEGTFNIGRVAEIQGRDGRMIRRNQIVLDSDSASATVSRMHARIHGTRERGSLTFTLFDEGSQRGSVVVRGGRPHKVVQGPSGFRLKDGDELYLGKVRLQFRLRT